MFRLLINMFFFQFLLILSFLWLILLALRLNILSMRFKPLWLLVFLHCLYILKVTIQMKMIMMFLTSTVFRASTFSSSKNEVSQYISASLTCVLPSGIRCWHAPKFLIRPKLGLNYSHSGIVRNLEHAPNSQH